MSHNIRIFDPRDQYQRGEFLSGRWTLKLDELEKLFDVVADEEDIGLRADYDELSDELDAAEKHIENLQAALERAISFIDDADDSDISESAHSKLSEILDAV